MLAIGEVWLQWLNVVVTFVAKRLVKIFNLRFDKLQV